MLYRFGAFELDEDAGELRRGGEPVPLQPKPFELLRILLRERERVVSAGELFEALWPGVAVTPGSLTRAVSVARRAIGDTHRGSTLRSVARRGYRFVGDVVALEAAGARRSAPAGTPRPDAGAAFVGREAELSRLGEAWDAATSGRGGVVLISGAPGMGKSCLAEAFAEARRREGHRVLWSGGREGEGVPALWIWGQVLRGLLSQDPDGSARRELEIAGSELADLIPDLAGGAPARATGGATVGQRRFLFFDAVARSLRAAARYRPLLVVLEDLQWAGPASLHLFEHVATSTSDAPLLLLATVREEDEGAPESLDRVLERVRQASHAVEIRLRGLSRGEVGALLERTIGAHPPPDLTSELLARTEGVPLFVREAIRMLAESGELRRPERIRHWSVTFPTRVLDLLRRPLQRLSPECGALLAAASVLGREFPLALAAPLAELTRERALDALDEAEQAGVVQSLPDDPASWRFQHALHREAVYTGLPSGRRTRLHAEAARALEQQYGDREERVIAELAHHHHQGLAAGDPERAFACAVRAAERAHRLRDFEQAALHRAQALAALGQVARADPERRLEALFALGDARGLAGDRAGRLDAFARAAADARGLGLPEALARAAIGLCDLTEWSTRDDEVQATLAEALACLPADNAPARAALLTRLAYLDARSDPPRAERLAREAAAGARACGDPDLIVDTLYVLHFVIAGPRGFAERAALSEESRAAAPSASRPEEAVIALVDVASDCLACGDTEGARRHRAAAAELAGARPLPGMAWHMLAYDAGVAHLEGRFADAERLNREGLLVGRRIEHPYARGVYDAHRVSLARDRGEAESVVAIFGPYLAPALQRPVAWMSAVVGRAEVELGRAEASARFAALAAAGFEALPRGIRWLSTLTEISHLCADLGDAKRAAELEELLRPVGHLHGVLPVPICYGGPLARALARLAALQGRLDEAAELFEEARASAEALGALPMAARILVEQGELLARRGSRSAARARLEEAAARAEALAMGSLRDTAREALRRLGG